MRACQKCGLSIGDTATFCPVCGCVAEQGAAPPSGAPPRVTVTSEHAAASSAGETRRVSSHPHQAVSASGPEAEAHRCEKTDPPRAAALYRRAIVDCLDGEDPLGSTSGRRDLQRLYDRLSLVLKRSGLTDEALEEIESAAYLGLVDDEECGTKAHRDALVKRRDTLRRAASRQHSTSEATLDRA
jgi:hypothetical protein